MHPSISGLLVIGCIYFLAGLILFPFAFFAGGWALKSSTTVWFGLAYCVVFATAFSYGGIAWATKRGVESTTVSIFITIEPFITAGLSRVFLKDIPQNPITFLLCASLVAAGVALVLDKDDAKYEPIEDSTSRRPSVPVGKVQQP